MNYPTMFSPRSSVRELATSGGYTAIDQTISRAPVSAIEFAITPSSLGLVLVARSERGLCAVLFGDEPAGLRRDLQARFPRAETTESPEALGDLADAVVAYIESPKRGLDVPLDVRGTDFQRTVWQALQEIPAGSTASYSDIAARIGQPTAMRAVAQACGANALAVVIPCHRVVTVDGKVTGYRWGVERKRALLDREAAGRSAES
jgi:AraC family transcriptional regulator of adaptative response/methylated-DNA-[protein]-cysteine methyltransferase